MDPIELLKSAPELQSIAAIIVGGVPFAEIVKRIVLPSADALGERMKGRVERLFEKTGKMIQDAGVAPQPVSDKLLIDILRGASVEDNDDLQRMWAALLANAASPENVGRIRPTFIAILKQLAPDEASMLKEIAAVTVDYVNVLQTTTAGSKEALDRMLKNRTNQMSNRVISAFASLPGETRDETDGRFQTCLQSLSYLGLLDVSHDLTVLSAYGKTFIDACQPPKPKENG
jgi:hypothetical protein